MPSSRLPSDSDARSTAPLIAWQACRGTLSDGEHTVDVVCDVAVARDGTVALDFADVPLTSGTSWLRVEGASAHGLMLPHFTLSLTGDCGDRLDTRHVILTSIGTSWTPSSSVQRIAGEALNLTVTHAPTPEWATAGIERLARYHLVGLRGFGLQQEDADVGRITLMGASEVADHRELAGELAVESTAGLAAEADWIGSVDGRVQEILLMVSLGAGRLVRWSIRELVVGHIRRTLEFRGRQDSGPPYDPLFHRLHLAPALQLGTHHYTRELGQRTGLDIAVEWYVMSHRYSESRFLASMTALEHIVSRHAKQLGAVLPKAAFRRVRDALDATLADPATRDEVRGALVAAGASTAEADTAAATALGQLAPKLGNLNRLSLQDSVVALLTLYGVPHADVSPDVGQLIKVRNSIAHRGLHAPGDEGAHLIEVVASLRELLRRLFLAILGYSGPYQSHLNGIETRHFHSVIKDALPVDPQSEDAPGDSES